MFEVAVSGILKQLLDKRPFVAFEVVLADGRVVKVGNPETAWLEFDSALFYVVRMKPADEPLTEIIVVPHIAVVRVSERLTPPDKNECPF